MRRKDSDYEQSQATSQFEDYRSDVVRHRMLSSVLPGSAATRSSLGGRRCVLQWL